MRTGMKSERLRLIEEYISQKEFVTVEELSERFHVHSNTVRSDINELAEKGIVEKKYGGISYKSYIVPSSYAERTEMGVEPKKVIARQAATLLEEDDVVFIDTGTTAALLLQEAETLPSKLTIITNSIPVINWCFTKTSYSIYTLPGKGERQMNSFASLETIEAARTYNIHKAFMGTRGIASSGDLSSASQIDAKIKAAVIEHSQKAYLMSEADKVNRPALINFANLSLFDSWICNERTSEAEELAARCRTGLITP